ncbi:hypothetical protein ABID21_001940 [Pseudorhizobium tarimense]|uniref:DUF4376 domain-containing protein n=1 Tax=Pseudorhizobium tarimense TaxID=1079109 RepID=A0ABV2H5K6_9HYPH|nr:hypothetical protein [Pseudorhizobium tarimense]MCJ8519032.1 hypothetical protein [Pseudorhizobium tarimense]
MKFFVTVDAEGFPSGFYNDQFHTAEQIPDAAIEITQEQWEDLNLNSGLRKLVDGSVVEVEPQPPQAQPTLSLTARQLRLGLVTNGFALDQVEAAIAVIEDPQQRAVAQIEWEYASQFERSHPLIEQVGAALGLTVTQIDAMWDEALTL